jgi:hypothetical protein
MIGRARTNRATVARAAARSPTTTSQITFPP